ncbi:quorum-sensing autoinducer CAI-1 synthase [Hydrogenophaga aromaticivorans]|uniref:alpha-hydroxyketone-type quorum-sensing autoinducer synthase n=1 Tax=Hydrogenophaga aromaticivorans TaxID=2610898 RepID=UPI001B38BCA9|nr:alpha-hydroxyketone-type quorum-sensing autoinducer synthase [Hydrogenophaga aromaticivorans]MBQ0917048.1 quorum-sensing autoinducer CAI-1 synthase [Hydrogenophaga aromaticivorans]
MQTVEAIREEVPLLSGKLIERVERDFLPMWQRWGNKFILHGRQPGPDAVRVDGNDYLSVTGHPDIVAAQIDALRTRSEQVIQSSVLLLNQHPTRQLEMQLAHWVGKDDAFLLQSGYAANVGLLQSIADKQTPIYLDALAHASLWEGAHTARSPAILVKHNDPKYLHRMLEQHGPGIVVVDSVYSTTGAICQLEEILDVVESHHSMILVDESHALGTHGPEGAGICAQLGVTDRVHFITASLAKTMAGRAGFFTAPPSLRHHILSSSFPIIFSSCMLPAEIAGLQATVRVVQEDQRGRDRLKAITQRVRGALSAIGYPIHQGTEQIIALESGTEKGTDLLRNELEARGIFGAVFGPPATSKNRCMVRITLHAGLTDKEIDRLIDALREIAPIVNPWEWAIARRIPGLAQAA